MDRQAAAPCAPSRRRLVSTCIAIAVLWIAGVGWVAIAWQREDPVRQSIRMQGQRECRREQRLNLMPGETYDECVERWIRMLWN